MARAKLPVTPAVRALRAAKCADQNEPPAPTARDPPRGRHEGKTAKPDQPQDAAQLAMSPFPPEDGLEGVDIHPAVLKLELRDLFISLELSLPVGIG